MCGGRPLFGFYTGVSVSGEWPAPDAADEVRWPTPGQWVPEVPVDPAMRWIVFALGVTAIMFPVAGPVGWWLAVRVRRRGGGDGLVTAGMVLSIVMTVLLAVYVLFLLLVLGLWVFTPWGEGNG